MTNKTVAERLRGMAAEDIRAGAVNCRLSGLFETKCDDVVGCGECVAATLNVMADMIEAEQAELRKYAYDAAHMYIDIAALDLLCDKLDCGSPNYQDIAKQIRKAMEGVERTKAEHDGVDVDALLNLADELEDSATGHYLATRIRDAVKGATGSKSTPLPEGVNVPLDADEQPCFLDDAVWHKGRKHLVVAVSHKGKVCIRDWETRDSGKGAVWVKAERVAHKEPDTQYATIEDQFADGCWKVGTYGCYAPMLTYPDSRLISVDRCLVPEIATLQLQGIKTIGCCCGHPKDRERGNRGYIQVDPASVDAMLSLGYEQLPTIPIDDNPDHDMQQWCFVPKIKLMGGE